jgi:hypothetical protein
LSQIIFNGPWVLPYFGPIKLAQFNLFYKSLISNPIQGPNSSLPPAATTNHHHPLSVASSRRPPPLTATLWPSPMTFLAKKEIKKKNQFIFPKHKVIP